MHRAKKRLIERSVFMGASLVVIVDLASWYANRGQELLEREPIVKKSTSKKPDDTAKVWKITVGQHQIVEGFLFPEEVTSINNDQIFFLDINQTNWYTADPLINKKKLCAVESAAKHHPQKIIYFIVTGVRFKLTPTLKVLARSYQNIKFVRFKQDASPDGYTASFAFDEQSQYADLHRAEIARYVLLSLYGGVYLDSDLIVTKPLTMYNSTIGHRQFREFMELAPHVMIFPANHSFLDLILLQTPNFYDSSDRKSLGSKLVNAVYQSSSFNKSLIKLPRQQTYNLIPREDQALAFDEDEGVKLKTKADRSKVHLVHYWNSLSNGTFIDLASSQMLALEAWANCPKVSRKAKGYM